MGQGQTSAERTVKWINFRNSEKGDGSYKEDILKCNNVCSVNLIVECNCVKESSYGCHANNSTCICKASFYGEKCDKGMNKN